MQPDYVRGAVGSAIASGMGYRVMIHDPMASPQNQWAEWFCMDYSKDGDTISMEHCYFAMGDPTARFHEVIMPLRAGYAIVEMLAIRKVANAYGLSEGTGITQESSETLTQA